MVKEGAIFATNTSSLPVAEQAAATSRPERFLGLHFFNPAQVMPLLEVVRAEGTGRRRGAARLRAGREARQDHGGRGGQPRVHRQPAPRPVHARRDPRLRAGRGLDRGHRRRHEGGRQPPDGAADARRLRRPGHLGVDRRRDARGLWGGALRAAADAHQAGRGRPLRTQVRPRASTTTRASDPAPTDLGI